ncbi:cytochrome P450 2K1-like isoform X2 [Mixophyes fleayi]|uniref:cytochrome P450 2K1-like isoform X2 n=1 Tax=Mixophyes fleayi TaxID=3061075 RepID=UPI003F4DCF3A
MTFITYLVSRVDVLLCLTACIALFIYWINGSKKKTGKMPPGPSPLPLIGNLNLMDLNKPYKSLMELSEKYGEVFTIHFGPKKVVILAGYKAVKDALVNQADDFGQRADIPIFKLLTKEMGLIFSHGELWKSTRRFTLSTLRDFGMGRKTIEARIQDELNPLVEKFKSHNGKPFATHTILNAAVSNVISSIIFGKRFEYDDPEFIKLIRLVIETTHLVGAPKLAESTKAETYFNDENLNYTVLDLFSAGSETTSTTLCWGILLMTKYPDIQKRVQEEIRTHIKAGQLPTVDDRRNMPYTDAVIHEIQRFANIVPLNLTHTTANDVYFRGYCIPKGTDVIPFLTSVLYDKTQWKTPNEFNPHHFLDAAGKFVRQDAFMPFSAGRRACVGESLAKMELFLFFTGLLQAFTFHQPTGVSRADLSLKPDIGFLLLPMPHLICAKLND